MRLQQLIVAMAFFFFISGCAASRQREFHHASTSDSELLLIPRLHFLFGSDALGEEAIRALEQNADWLKEHPQEVLVLEGHCDEHGDELLNLELGDRRARSVKHYLIASGIDPDRTIMIVSFGEEKPLDVRHSQEAWQMNRRVEFIVR